MAVPKKKASKSKTKSRLSTWSSKVSISAEKALSTAKFVLAGKHTSFTIDPVFLEKFLKII